MVLQALTHWGVFVVPRLGLLSILLALTLPVGDFIGRVVALVFVAGGLWFLFLRMVQLPAISTNPKSNLASLALLMVAFAIHFAISGYFSCWCCIRERDIEQLCNELASVIDVLKKNDIPAWYWLIDVVSR